MKRLTITQTLGLDLALVAVWLAGQLPAAAQSKASLASGNATFVRVSPRDSRYFELTDGKPYIPVGFKLVGPPDASDMERVVETMAKHGVNYCRICTPSDPGQSGRRARVGGKRKSFSIGNQTRSGYSSFAYRPFTLEGNFLAAQAVQELLLQSWSPTHGRHNTEALRVFPAMPWRWHDASFRDLRAEGKYRVSARRENNATTWLRIVATRDSVLPIQDNFGEQTPQWNVLGVRRVGSQYEARLKKGQAVEATLAKSTVIPAAPAMRPDR